MRYAGETGRAQLRRALGLQTYAPDEDQLRGVQSLNEVRHRFEMTGGVAERVVGKSKVEVDGQEHVWRTRGYSEGGPGNRDASTRS